MPLGKKSSKMLKKTLRAAHFYRDAGTILNRIFAEQVENGWTMHVGKVGGLSKKDRHQVATTAKRALRHAPAADELVFDPPM